MKIPPFLTGEKLKLVVLIGLVGILAILGVTMWGVLPTLKKKQKLMKEWLQKSEQLDKEEKLVARKDKLGENVKNLKERSGELLKTVPNSTGEFSMLLILNQNADGADIVFERLEPREVPESEAIQLPPFNQKDYFIRMKAGYHQLGNFINRLENVSPFIEVKDIKIFGLSESPDSHDISLTLRALRK